MEETFYPRKKIKEVVKDTEDKVSKFEESIENKAPKNDFTSKKKKWKSGKQ